MVSSLARPVEPKTDIRERPLCAEGHHSLKRQLLTTADLGTAAMPLNDDARWPALAAMLGARPPLHLPAWIARLVADKHLVTMMTRVRAGSNANAKADLDRRPAYPSWHQGFSDIAANVRR